MWRTRTNWPKARGYATPHANNKAHEGQRPSTGRDAAGPISAATQTSRLRHSTPNIVETMKAPPAASAA